MRSTEFWVDGHAAPQGSKHGFVVNGHVNQVEMSKRLPSWRKAVSLTARQAHGERAPLDGSLELIATFWMPRPKSHPKTRLTVPTSPPDLDKLVRAIGDALKLGDVIVDDARITRLVVEKDYALDESLVKLRELYPKAPVSPGVHITIRERWHFHPAAR